ncbi:hypothetical protein I203_102337 [Kwoniella mangroviensis CBS 8507]|uniref:uncharacterized protein n=1 Tax=Kwoniella mangroviensis CBS 8507 TaxID=1296122 RepID=UPI00080D095E|nr:uncharacterized protein I203_06455 [Kwoniella mangroviensis CBS 8507]OCF64274.1 hypothetical protein I203_06455 [Kwoniella mangroviensis CBS 8507]
MHPYRPPPSQSLDQTIHDLASQQATSKFIASMGRNPKEQDLGSAQYSTEYWNAHQYYTNHFAIQAKERSDCQTHIEVATRTDPSSSTDTTNIHSHNGGYWTRVDGTRYGMNRIQYEQFPHDSGAGTAATGGGRDYRPDRGSPILGNTSGIDLAINDQVFDQSFHQPSDGASAQGHRRSSHDNNSSHGNPGYLGLPTHQNPYSPLSVQGWSGATSPAPSVSGSDGGAGYPYYAHGSGSEGEGGYDVSQVHTPNYPGTY